MKRILNTLKTRILPGGMAVLLLLFLFFLNFAGSPTEIPSRTVIVNIPKGASFIRIVDILDRGGLVKNKGFFTILAIVKKAARHIRAGEYEVETAMSPSKILDKLVRGEIKEYRVTIPEDFSVKDIAARLISLRLVQEQEFFSLACDQDFLVSLNIAAPSIEGYLYPDTYIFDRSMGTKEIVKTMVKRFWEKITPTMIEEAEKRGMDLTKFITLASIIGKEAGNKEEKNLISAVFHNRLKKGMRLQSDPTAVYDLTRPFNRVITRQDLRNNIPHNTYRIKGLPPGPIANPGLDSFYAALYPAPVNYLYFVSKNDGSHQFSPTFSAHNDAVIKYQIDKNK